MMDANPDAEERKIESTVSGFTPLFDAVVQDLGLTAAVVFGRVWRHCQGERGVCSASLSKMADAVGLSRWTFIRWLRMLCEQGYLEDLTPDRRNIPHLYRDSGKVRMIVKVETRDERSRQGGVTESPTGVAESNTGVAQSNTGVAQSQLKKPIRKNKETRGGGGSTEGQEQATRRAVLAPREDFDGSPEQAATLSLLTAFGIAAPVAHRLAHDCDADQVRAWITYAGNATGLRDPVGLVVRRLQDGEPAPDPPRERTDSHRYAQDGDIVMCPTCYTMHWHTAMCPDCGGCESCCKCEGEEEP